MHIPHKPFYFVRHGETEWNKQGIYMGQKDISLNDTGKAQAHDAKKGFKKEPILGIVTSSLSRAYETAQIINESLGVPLTVLDELRERRLGPVEGERQKDEKIFQKWLGSVDILKK